VTDSGVTPAVAVQEFIAPLQQALSCVAHGKISTRRGGEQPKIDQGQQWSLNDGGGAVLRKRHDGVPPGKLELYASVYWRVIKINQEGLSPYRVATTGYDYSLVIGETCELWAMHWHPQGGVRGRWLCSRTPVRVDSIPLGSGSYP